MVKTSLKWSVIYLLEGVALLIALCIFGGALALWRLSQGPVELDFLRQDAQTMLAQAFDGEVVALGELTARFDVETAALVISARDVTVADSEGRVLARAPVIEAGLAVDALMLGQARPVMLDIDGGSVSVVRLADGAVGAGLGGVERVALQARLPRDRQAARAGGSDETRSLLEILRNVGQTTPVLERLQQVVVRNASVRLKDEISGVDWLLEDAGVMLDREDGQVRAGVSGQLLTAAGFAPISLNVEADAGLTSLLLDAHAEALNPATIAPLQGELSALGILDAAVTLDLSVNAHEGEGIRTAMLDVQVAEGRVRLGDEWHAVSEAGLRLSLDPEVGELILSEGRIRSAPLDLDIQGRFFNLGQYDGVIPTRLSYDGSVQNIRFNLPDVFDGERRVERVAAAGAIDVRERHISLSPLRLDVLDINAELAGEAFLSEPEPGRVLPNLRLSGPLDGVLNPREVLDFWPIPAADGARVWVDEHVMDGRLSNARLDLDLNAEAFLAGALDNERMALSFDFEDALVYYISTMTPITQGRGSAVLRGNAFELTMESGRIGDLELEDGYVDIPRLNPKGAIARYGGRGRGLGSDILALIDQEPMGYPSDYGIDPQSVGGYGEMRFEIQRAMLSEVPPEEVGFDIAGTFEDASLDVPGLPEGLTDGRVQIEANPSGLTARGEAKLLDADLNVVWRETFFTDDEPGTEIDLTALVGTRTLDQLGLPVRRLMDGRVGVTAHVISDGLDLRQVDIEADLTPAIIELPADIYYKPENVPGEASLTFSRSADGTVRLDEVHAASEGFLLDASAAFAPDGRLLQLSAPQVFIEGLVNGALEAGAGEGLGEAPALLVRVDAEYLDLSSVLPEIRAASSASGSPPSEEAEPEAQGQALYLDAQIDELRVSPTRAVSDMDIVWRAEPEGVRAFTVTGTAEDGAFLANFGAQEEGGARLLHALFPDTQGLASLVGAPDYFVGGVLSVEGEAPPLGHDGPLFARLEVQDLTLIQMPVLARILAAGSFEGLGALLNGEGINIESVNAELMIEDGVLTIGELRAAGPSIGMTASGSVDFTNQNAGLDGTLAPTYALNSLFGNVPLIGGLLVSRPGEGVIGVTFSVEGPFDSLTVFANPLSALAPGVLRRIFEGTAAQRAAEDRARRDVEPLPTPVEVEPDTEPDTAPTLDVGEPAGTDGG